MCADTISVATGPQGAGEQVCVTEDGMPLLGNIGATRPRVHLQGYDNDNDGIFDSAWVLVVSEESKGMGKFFFTPDGTACTEGTEGCEEADIGKDIRYYTFSMSLQDTRTTEENGLINNLGVAGFQLNQPEVDWRTGQFYPLLDTAQMWDFGDYNFQIYRTEIARRGSLVSQPHGKAGTSRLVALPTWKQGIMQQGGPADVMARRILKPFNYVEGVTNPYAYENMSCATWMFADGSNPYYPKGLCIAPPINMSSVVPDTCVDNQTGSAVTCPTVDPATGIGTTDPILQGGDVVPNTMKVLTWHQCPSVFTTVSGETASCEAGDTNLADQSWYNPLDVAKGHRGFIEGNFVMLLYGWSPNWRLNAKGNDRNELYIRRSFDGANSWTTLPASFMAFDGLTYNGGGTTTCETFRTSATGSGGGLDEPIVCNRYNAGAPEQARNVTQLKSMKFTTLDPRWAPEKPRSIVDPLGYPDEDTRDPSRYFVVYETGDNTTTEFGEAEPLNLYYGRAIDFGDHYQVWAEEDGLTECFPSNPQDNLDIAEEIIGSGFCNEFDELEGKKDSESSEASLEQSPGGQFLYGAWSQIDFDLDTGEELESNAMFRRVWYIDGYIPTEAWDVPGDRIFTSSFEE